MAGGGSFVQLEGHPNAGQQAQVSCGIYVQSDMCFLGIRGKKKCETTANRNEETRSKLRFGERRNKRLVPCSTAFLRCCSQLLLYLVRSVPTVRV